MTGRCRMLSRLIIALGWLASVVVAGSSRAETFVVVVNAENHFAATEEAARSELRRLYLKSKSAWPDTVVAVPYARPTTMPAQKAFVEHVLGFDETDLERHWRRLRETTGARPPETVESARELLQRVARNPGAFGVVGRDEAPKLPANVRVLLVLQADD